MVAGARPRGRSALKRMARRAYPARNRRVSAATGVLRPCSVTTAGTRRASIVTAPLSRGDQMPEYAPGTPCWVELNVPDTDAAARFYGELFGWDATAPDTEHGGEPRFQHGGR